MTSHSSTFNANSTQSPQQVSVPGSSAKNTPAPKVIRIAPERIKNELARAIQSGSFNKTNTLRLGGYQGNEIKIQIRIKDSGDNAATSSSKPATTSLSQVVTSHSVSTASPGQPLRIHAIQSQASASTPQPAQQQQQQQGVADNAGRRSITISSAAMRSARPGEFTPLMKVEKSLPSQFLDEPADDAAREPAQGDVIEEEVAMDSSDVVGMETELPASVAEEEVVAEQHAFLVDSAHSEEVVMETEGGSGDGGAMVNDGEDAKSDE